MSLIDRILDSCGESFYWWLTGRSPVLLPVIPRFTISNKGKAMQLTFSALAQLSDQSFRYVMTVTPQGGTPASQTLIGGATPQFPGLPAGSGTITLVVKDGNGDPLSPASTEPYAILPAPTIPAFTVDPDPASAPTA